VDKAKVRREIQGWVITILAVLAFRTLLYEAVYIPSGSMIPTLQIGDYVVVEKFAYGARLPFTERAQVMWSSPERGDIVVLLAPPGNPRNDDLIKRVVGIAGDEVEVKDGALWLNGKPVPRLPRVGPCVYENRLEGGPWREEKCVAAEEQLDKHRYLTYCTPGVECGDVPPTVVPPGNVFLVGDHRDHSADSRVFGPVPVNRIKGRAWNALFSWGPGGLRTGRVAHSVTH
jgi:signal peptidase I